MNWKKGTCILLMIALSFSLLACSKNEASSKSASASAGESIVGEWQSEEDSNYFLEMKFEDDGTFIIRDSSDYDSGTWEDGAVSNSYTLILNGGDSTTAILEDGILTVLIADNSVQLQKQ